MKPSHSHFCATLQPPKVISMLFLYTVSPMNQTLRLRELRKWSPPKETLDCQTISLCQTIRNVKRPVWRIWILMLRFKELMEENEKEVITNLRFVRNLVFLCFAWRCETSCSPGWAERISLILIYVPGESWCEGRKTIWYRLISQHFYSQDF